MFVGAVVVASDRPRADIDRAAEGGVADVAQMIDLAATADVRRFGFDEIADAYAFAQHRFRPQPREWPDLRVGAHLAMLQTRMAVDARAAGDGAIIEHAAAFNIDVVAEAHRAFQHDICLNHHIVPGTDRAMHINARRINQGNARCQQRLRLPLPPHRFRLRLLRAGVDAQRFCGVSGGDGHHAPTSGDVQGDDIRQIKLAGGVVVLQLRQIAGEVLAFHRHHAGIDFADGALSIARVLFLDDSGHLARRIAHDAPIAEGVISDSSQKRETIVPRRIEQTLQRFRAHQRRIAIKNQHQLGLGNLIQRHAHRVPGAALLGLGNPAQLRPGGSNTGAQLLALMAVNHRAARRRERLQRLQQMHNHRLAADWLQNFRLGGMHAFTLTGGENERERFHVNSLWMR